MAEKSKPFLGILGDNDVCGQVRILGRYFHAPGLHELWSDLNLTVYIMEDLGLSADDPDAVIWQTCQDKQIALITGNRNKDGPDSVEAVLQSQNSPHALPVFTLANPMRVRNSKSYARRTAERLLDYLRNIDAVRGVGRLYIP